MTDSTGPVCRLCRYALKAHDGCAVCLPVKRNLVWPAVLDESEVATAQAVTQEATRMIQTQLRKLKRELKGNDYRPELTNDLIKIGRTLKELAGEIRKLEDRESAQYADLSFDAKIQLYIDQFFALLPQEHQKALLRGCAEVYEVQSKPQLLPGEEDIVDAEVVSEE